LSFFAELGDIGPIKLSNNIREYNMAVQKREYLYLGLRSSPTVSKNRGTKPWQVTEPKHWLLSTLC
jgi:hypothetical protein